MVSIEHETPTKRTVDRRTYRRTTQGRADNSRLTKTLRRGFVLRHSGTMPMVRELSKDPGMRMVWLAVFYWCFIILTIKVALAIAVCGAVFGAIAYVVALICVARTMRAFEAMTHEFGHGVLPKSRLRLNDAIGNISVSLPMGITIASMRRSHNGPHHVDLAMSADPDLRRYNEMNAHSLDRSSAWRFGIDIATRLPTYLTGWFQSLGTNIKTVSMSLSWHVVAILISGQVYGDLSSTFKIWVFFWFVPYLFVLPIIRFIGELSEHAYFAGSDIIAVTVSNIGAMHRLLIHPLGDGFHTLHHIFPSVRGYNLKKLHEWMLQHEPDYCSNLRYRVRVLENPRKGLLEIHAHPAMRWLP